MLEGPLGFILFKAGLDTGVSLFPLFLGMADGCGGISLFWDSFTFGSDEVDAEALRSLGIFGPEDPTDLGRVALVNGLATFDGNAKQNVKKKNAGQQRATHWATHDAILPDFWEDILV